MKNINSIFLFNIPLDTIRALFTDKTYIKSFWEQKTYAILGFIRIKFICCSKSYAIIIFSKYHGEIFLF